MARYLFTQPELLLVQSPSPGSFVWFSLICSRRGGSTAAAMTRDSVADERKKKMADGVTRSPTRLCSRDGKIGYYGRLEYDFLAFVPYFSVQQSSSTLSKYIFYGTCFFFLREWPGIWIA